MPIKKQVLPVSLFRKLDTDTDPKINQQGLIRCQDAKFSRGGAISKRFGTYTLDESFTDAYMATYKDSPLNFGKKIKVYDSYANDEDFPEADDITHTDISLEPLEMSGENYVFQKSMAELGNIRVIAWKNVATDATIRHQIDVWNIRTGRQIDTTTLVDAAQGSTIRAVATTTSILCFFVESTNQLNVVVIDSAGTIGGIGPYTEIPAVDGTLLDFDCALVNSSGTSVMLSYISGAGIYNGDGIVMGVTDDGTFDAYATTGLNSGQLTGIFKLQDGYAAAMFYDEKVVGYEIDVGVWRNDMAQAMEMLDLKSWNDANWYPTRLVGTSLDGETAYTYYEWNDDGYSYPEWDRSIRQAKWTFNGFGSAGTLNTEGQFLQGHYINSKPFDDGTDHFLIVSPNVGTADNPLLKYVIYSDKGFIHGKFMDGEVFPTAVPDWVTLVSSENWRWVGTLFRTDDTMGLTIVDITKNIASKDIIGIEALNTIEFPSSVSYEWDNQLSHEQGFINYPHRIDTEARTYTGSPEIDAPSTYSYVATYEWWDNQGNKHQSAPSLNSTVIVNTGKQKVKVHVPTLTMTKKDFVNVVLWRTDGYGVIYRRVEAKANSKLDGYCQFFDTLADSTLLTRPSIYTTGGILENVAPPPTRISTIHQNRQFVVNREDESRDIRYSKQFTPREGLAHSDFLTVEVSPEGGAITALKSFLDRLIIFKKSRIYAIYGNGLNDLGVGSGYSDPQLIYPSIGCINQKSVVETPSGLMFLASDNQIYLLNRSLTVQPLGSPVKYWSESQTIESSYVLEKENEASWVTQDGYALTYNWEYDMWSTWSNYNATDVTVADDTVWFHGISNDIFKQSASYTNDIEGGASANADPTVVETGWISFAGINGFARVKRILLLGQMADTHTLRVKIAYDNAPYYVDNYTYAANSFLETFGYETHFGNLENSALDDEAYILEITPSRQKITAMRLYIADEGGRGAGFELSGMAVEVGIKKGPYRVGTDRVD